MSRMGADNDGSDHNYRQRIDNVYQIRADKKAELKSKFPLLLVRRRSTPCARVAGSKQSATLAPVPVPPLLTVHRLCA